MHAAILASGLTGLPEGFVLMMYLLGCAGVLSVVAIACGIYALRVHCPRDSLFWMTALGSPSAGILLFCGLESMALMVIGLVMLAFVATVNLYCRAQRR